MIEGFVATAQVADIDTFGEFYAKIISLDFALTANRANTCIHALSFQQLQILVKKCQSDLLFVTTVLSWVTKLPSAQNCHQSSVKLN